MPNFNPQQFYQLQNTFNNILDPNLAYEQSYGSGSGFSPEALSKRALRRNARNAARDINIGGGGIDAQGGDLGIGNGLKGITKDPQFANKALGVVGGATSLIGQVTSMTQEAKSINTNAPGAQTDYLGRPLYNLGNFLVETSRIKPQGATAGEVTSGVMTGAAAGAAFGPIGIGVGAVVGGLVSGLGGRRRKVLQRRKKAQAEKNLYAAQQLYNNAIGTFNMSQVGMADYNKLMNNENRMQNLYTYNAYNT